MAKRARTLREKLMIAQQRGQQVSYDAVLDEMLRLIREHAAEVARKFTGKAEPEWKYAKFIVEALEKME